MTRKLNLVLILCATTFVLSAQTYTTLLSFNGTNGCTPQYASLVQGADGNFYGTTSYCGTNNLGTVFKVTPAGMLTTLHNFIGPDGSHPLAGLILASDGNFYGVTDTGGGNAQGTIFKMTPAGVLTTLHSFVGLDGAYPTGTLVQGRDGNFYGTTFAGGAFNQGTIFQMGSNGTLTIAIHSFAGGDGSTPIAGLLQASDGNLYGATTVGGVYNYGTIFRITTTGVFTSIYSFQSGDGAQPSAALMQASDGNLYGTTEVGGLQNTGTIFRLSLSGTLTVIHTFFADEGTHPCSVLIEASDGDLYGTTAIGGTGGYGSVYGFDPAGLPAPAPYIKHSFTGTGTDGATPWSGLIQGTDGNLYGLTSKGGASNDGTVYSVDVLAPTVSGVTASAITGSAATLSVSVNPNGRDTKVWFAYSTNDTLSGYIGTILQDIGAGTSPVAVGVNISSLSPNTQYYFDAAASNSGGESVSPVETFSTTGAPATYTISGAVTLSGAALSGVTMTIAGSQNASTTTNGSGAYSFTVTPGGTYTVTPSLAGYTFSPPSQTLNNVTANQTVNFTAAPASTGASFATLVSLTASSGNNPVGGVVQASDGNFYGPGAWGGSYYGSGDLSVGAGAIFKVTPAGVLTTLHNFVGTDGWAPESQLIQASDGDLYGTTFGGGANNAGTVFKLTLSGAFTTLYNFCAQSNCSDGSAPYGVLLQASDGNFYGAATAGGSNDNGTIFKITPAGVLTTVYAFTGGDDGAGPAIFLQATDGNLYGSTGSGASGYGTIFKITLGGVLTTLHTFTAADGFTGPDGTGASVIQARDGSFYGTTIEGGPGACGTVFKMTPAGALTSLASLSKSDGCVLGGPLFQASDGNFYGEARGGAINGYGSIVQVTPSGTLTTLHMFTGSDGIDPVGGFIQATDGNLYGTTQKGGVNNDGTVFRLGLPGSTPSVPSIVTGGVLNAASYAKDNNGWGMPVAPGSLVAIFTSPLATTPATFSTASLPVSLSGVTVTFNGIPAPMVAVSPTGAYPYVSAQVPFEVLAAGQSSASVPVVVTVNNVASAPMQTSIVPSAPGIYTIPPTGQGNAILVFTNPATNQPAIAAPASAGLSYPTAPIPPGTAAFFYVNGLGAMTPSVQDGSGTCSATNDLCFANAVPTVTVGGVPAQVIYAGQAPGFPGVFQVNITVPQNAPSGSSVPLVVTSADGSVTSNTATIAVASAATGAPALSVSPSSLAFGNVIVGQFANLTLTLSNTGTAALTISSLTFNNSQFTLTVPIATLFQLSPGKSTGIQVSFLPTSAGAQNGTLTIASNDPNHPSLAVPLTGTGVSASQSAPTLSLSTTILTFGYVSVGQTGNFPLTVSNTGTAALIVNSVQFSGSTTFSCAPFVVPFTVPAGGSVTLTFQFEPDTTGVQSGTATIASNDPNHPSVTIQLAGTGVASTGPVAPGPVDLSAAFNRTGIYTDGSTFSSTGGPMATAMLIRPRRSGPRLRGI